VLIANSAHEKPLTQIVYSNCNCNFATWISQNQLVCGYDDGTFEIHETEIFKRQLKIRMVQKIRHNFSDGTLILPLSYPIMSSFTFPLHFEKRYDVLSVAWNEELKLLASGGGDGRIKVYSDKMCFTDWIQIVDKNYFFYQDFNHT